MSIIQEYNKTYQEETYEVSEQNKFLYRLKNTLCQTNSRGLIFLVLFALVIPPLVYYLVIDKGVYHPNTKNTCLITKTFRVTCGPFNISEKTCLSLQCCFDNVTGCYHFLPSKYSYDVDETDGKFKAVQIKTPLSRPSISELQMTVREINSNTVSVVVHDGTTSINASEVPDDKNYNVTVHEDVLMVDIFRGNGDLLLTTSNGPLIASEHYWEWTFHLTDDKLMGLDQSLINLDENSTLTKVIYKNRKDHNTVPLFWAYKNGLFHGVLVKHAGPLEVTVLPSNMVVLKSIAGSWIELELSVGPTPQELHLQQNRNQMVPPYWVLEPHLCRGGDSIDLRDFIKTFQVNSGDFRSECLHENLLYYLMTAGDASEVLHIIEKIRSSGLKFLLSVPPQIIKNSLFYNESEVLDLFYKDDDGIYEGKYLKQDVVYPDFSHANAEKYVSIFNDLLDSTIGADTIDGFVLTKNWPENELNPAENDTEDFPYLPKTLLDAMSYTLPWNAAVDNNLHIIKHNSYGWDQNHSLSTYFSSLDKDKVIMSASSVYGEAQPLIIEEVDVSWTNLKVYLNQILFQSISGNRLISVPVCGSTSAFKENAQEVICVRWYLLAATMPILRVSSVEPYRDPDSLDTGFAKNFVKETMMNRAKLLPHYYGILQTNQPVVRPMFYDFYGDNNTFYLDEQYMIGTSLLVAHPFTLGTAQLKIYLPPSVGVWYEFWGGMQYDTSQTDGWIRFSVVQTDWVMFIAQGTVIPLKEDKNLDLTVALNCSASPCMAAGTLLEDNSVLTFAATEESIVIGDIPDTLYDYILRTINIYKGDSTSVCKPGISLSSPTVNFKFSSCS